ncbi:MAG: hypothetical protein ACI8ZM_005517, partial [Crocinitomix sp.]
QLPNLHRTPYIGQLTTFAFQFLHLSDLPTHSISAILVCISEELEVEKCISIVY